MEDSSLKVALWTVGAFVALILFLVLKPFVVVGAGNVGVVTRLGAVNRIANPGLVWKMPLFESVKQLETRTQIEQVDASSASKDLQEVKAKVALNFHLDAAKSGEVYQNIGTDYKDRIIAPAMQEAFKATTAKFTASDLIGKREEVKALAYTELKSRLEKYHLIVDDFNIVNFDFSDEFNHAIEAKTVAQQQVETEKQTLEKIKVQAEQTKTQAQGQADAQKALKDSGSLSPEYLQYLALTKWNGILPQYTGSNIPFVNIK